MREFLVHHNPAVNIYGLWSGTAKLRTKAFGTECESAGSKLAIRLERINLSGTSVIMALIFVVRAFR